MYRHNRQGANSLSIVGRVSTIQCPLLEVTLYIATMHIHFSWNKHSLISACLLVGICTNLVCQ